MKGRPTLIVLLPHLVPQWGEEVGKVTGKFKCYQYFGDKRENSRPANVGAIHKLTQDHHIFDGAKERNWVLVFTTYQTLASRNGPSQQVKWLKAQKKSRDDIKAGGAKVDKAWPGCLYGKFRTVVMDEAHSIRNLDSQQATAAHWLSPSFNLLLTATPSYNSIEDFKGLLPFILKPSNDRLWNDLGVDRNTNPFTLDDDDPRAVLRLSRDSVNRFIWKDNALVGGAVGHHLGKIWQRCMLRRCLSSRIPFDGGIMIGDSIPPTQVKRLNVKFTSTELKVYKAWEKELLKNIIIKRPDGRYCWNMAKYRQLTLIISWLWFKHVHDKVKGVDTKKVISGVYSGRLARLWVHKGMQVENQMLLANGVSSAEAFHSIPPKSTDLSTEETLAQMFVGSPKMRAMVPVIRDDYLLYGEKAVVWCNNPGQQMLVAATLNLAGLSAKVFHAHLDQNSRHELIRDFTTKPSECMVLVCSYYVNCSGLNLQAICRNVHLFDIPSSNAIAMQSMGRVIRVGQKRIIKVYEYFVEETFNVRQLSNNMNKVVPNMVAELNTQMINMAFDEETKEIDLGFWARKDDGSIQQVSKEVFEGLGDGEKIQSDDVIYELMAAMRDGRGDILNDSTAADTQEQEMPLGGIVMPEELAHVDREGQSDIDAAAADAGNQSEDEGGADQVAGAHQRADPECEMEVENQDEELEGPSGKEVSGELKDVHDMQGGDDPMKQDT